MLFIKPKKKKKTFAIPAMKKSTLEEIVENVSSEHSPGLALARIKKTKTYIEARLNGSSRKEAKALAGYKGNEKQLLQSPIGQTLLESLLSQSFPDEKINQRLQEMWDEADPVYDSKGQLLFHRKNHSVREFAFEKVLELRKLKAKDSDTGGSVPTTIVFNVQPIPPMPKSVVDGAVDVAAEEVK